MSDYKTVEVPTVRLQKTGKNTEIRYLSSPEEVGLVLDSTQQIAMFTSRTTPAVGPPGGDKNSWFDTIIASASDENTPLTVGGPKTTFRAPYPLRFDEPGWPGYVRCSLTTAPIGSPVTVSLTVNGTPLFTTPITIDAGSKTSVGAATPAVINPAMMYIPDDAEFLVYVNTVGSVFAGSGLKVAVTGVKTE